MSFKCHLSNLLYIHVILFQAVLNQKFTDCFVLVFLDTQGGKTVSYFTSMIITIIIKLSWIKHVSSRSFPIFSHRA